MSPPETPTSGAPSNGRFNPHRATRIALGVAILLVVIKAFALGASGSVSILVSLTESALSLSAALASFIAVRRVAGSEDVTSNLSRANGEALAGLVQAGLVFAAGGFVGWEAMQRIFDPRPVAGGVLAISVMLFSIGLTLFVLRMKSSRDDAELSGESARYTSIIAANFVVLVGVVSGAFLGAPGLDAAAGLVVSVWLVWGGVGLLRESTGQFLGQAATEAEESAIKIAVQSDPAILEVRQLQTRKAGSTMIIRIEASLHKDLSLDAVRAITEQAASRVRQIFPVADVTILPDPQHPSVAARPAKPPEDSPPPGSDDDTRASKGRSGPWS